MSASSSSTPEPSERDAALRRFAALVGLAEPPLGRCCALAAEHLGVDAAEDRAETALRALTASTTDAVGARPDLDAIAEHLFGTLGFGGDRARYHDRRNSILTEVLRRRRGIPITLAVVTIEVAGRLGVEASGVGMPGHFLVGDGARPARWLDPFDGGTWLDVDGARRCFARIHGDVPFDRAYLEPTPAPLILARVLANLLGVLRAEGDATAVLRAAELRSAIPGIGEAPRSLVELGEAYVTVGRVPDALGVLERVHELVDQRRRAGVRARIDLLRANLN